MLMNYEVVPSMLASSRQVLSSREQCLNDPGWHGESVKGKAEVAWLESVIRCKAIISFLFTPQLLKLDSF